MTILFARVLAACACVLFIAATPASHAVFAAAIPVDVRGSVTEDDATPIAGASVTLVSQAGSRSARTDARGRFHIANVPSGTYSVYAAAPGYARLSQRTVTVDPGNSTLSFVLSRATTNSLVVIGTVRVSAGATVSTASAPSADLSAQSAAAAGATTVSSMVWDQLGTTPVIPLGGGSNATVAFAVRGPDPTETLVDVDGHQVNNGNSGDFDLSLLDPAALQEVQVIYGISPSSLLGPNQIGGAINIVTLQPTTTPHALLRAFGGSYGSFGETAQATGSAGRFGYAFSLHGASSDGSVNRTVFAVAPPGTGPAAGSPSPQSFQLVGSNSDDTSMLGKLRYQVGGANGYGYLQFDFRGQSAFKDDSALLTNYTPPNFGGSGGDAIPFHNDASAGGIQSFSGTTLSAVQSNYGFDAQLPLGDAKVDGAPATLLQFSHLTTRNSQSVGGPGADTLPYLYNQRDLLADDWLQIDRHFNTGDLTFKYDLGTETLDTDYVQGQATAQIVRAGGPTQPDAAPYVPASAPTQAETLSQTQRSGVLRYAGNPTSQIHYSLEGYFSTFSTFGTSFDPRAGFVWTPTGNTAIRASAGTTFQAPQLSELVVPPLADRVAVGGVVYLGNPNLKPDHATDFDLGAEQLFGRQGHQLHLTLDLYQNNLRAPSSQLNVNGIGGCDPTTTDPAKHPCPISFPVNAGDGIYRGIDVTAERQFGTHVRVRAGWDVDSSSLTVIPASIQDGTLVAGQQSLGQPLHKAYVGFEREAAQGLVYGAQLNYEGFYNALNRTPYATFDAHVAYRNDGFEYGLYGTNLTNAYSQPFAVEGGGVAYGTVPPNAPTLPTAYVLQGSKVVFVVTRSI